jgi:hypothetical protein
MIEAFKVEVLRASSPDALRMTISTFSAACEGHIQFGGDQGPARADKRSGNSLGSATLAKTTLGRLL